MMTDRHFAQSDTGVTTEGCARLGVLATWNVWLMPWSAPDTYRRPRAQAKRLSSILRPILRSRGKRERKLTVVCLQECWAFQSGHLLYPFLWISSLVPRIPLCLRGNGCFDPFDLLGWIFLIAVALAGYIFKPISWLLSNIFCCGSNSFHIWNPRRLFRAQMAEIGCSYEISAGGCTFERPWRMFDNGLVMFASLPPKLTGYVRFHEEESFSEESLANKGMQYALFLDEKNVKDGGTLVVNMHGKCPSKAFGKDSAGPADAKRHIDEISTRIFALICTHQGMLRHIVETALLTDDPTLANVPVDVYICGDFNMERDASSMQRLMANFNAREISVNAGPTSCVGYPSLVLDMAYHFRCRTVYHDGDVSSRRRTSSALWAAIARHAASVRLTADGIERRRSVPLLDDTDGSESLSSSHNDFGRDDLTKMDDTEGIRTPWTSAFHFESRSKDALCPPKGTSPLWDCLWLRDVQSDHVLLVCSSNKED